MREEKVTCDGCGRMATEYIKHDLEYVVVNETVRTQQELDRLLSG